MRPEALTNEVKYVLLQLLLLKALAALVGMCSSAISLQPMYLLVFSLHTLHLPAGWVVVTCRLGGGYLLAGWWLPAGWVVQIALQWVCASLS